MPVMGVVAEYNPFHTGHLYHLQQAKKSCDADGCICVLSGPFVQRGEPAIVSKWARAEMALAGGADLVLELPFCYAVQSAHLFAENAVRLLLATGIVTHLAFGSESGDLFQLQQAAAVLMNETQQFQQLLSKKLREGLSYPHAFAASFKSTAPATIDPQIIDRPNDLLGLEYLQALTKHDPQIIPIGITRQGQMHGNSALTSFASASTIRRAIAQSQNLSTISSVIPESTLSTLKREFGAGRGPISWEAFEQMLLYRLRTATYSELQQLYTITEGLNHRIIQSAQSADDFNMLIFTLKTKRYTVTRLQRTLLYCLLSLSHDDAISFNHNGPEYLRVLGMNQIGKTLLKQIKKAGTLPIILRPAKYLPSNIFYHNQNLSSLQKMLRYDLLASDLYQLAFTANKQAGSDYTTLPVMLASSSGH